MNIEEQIEQAVRDWEDATRGIDAPFAEYVMPLVKRVQEAAWDEGQRAGWDEAKDPGAFVNDWWDMKTPNPYIDNEGAGA